MMDSDTVVPSQKAAAPPKRHGLAWLLVLLVCLALLLPLLHHGKAPMGMPGGGPGTPVTTAQVRSAAMDIYLDALGTVTPLQTVNVYSQVAGRVLGVAYREGEMVHKGQLLVTLDAGPTQAQLDQAQGSLVRDRALLDQARLNLHRYQEARQQNAIAEQTLSDQQSLVRQYEGTVQNDEGSVRYYQAELGYFRIQAPIAGRIGLRLVDAGNTVFSGSTSALATITQIDPITAVFSVAEDHVPQIQKQLAARSGLRVDLYDRSQTHLIATGKLLTLDNQVDTTTGTVKLRAQFSNAQNQLFPNQFVNARLQVDTLRDARLIPTVAVQYNGQQAFVYLVKADHTVAMHTVQILNADQNDSAVAGLELGDSVVTSNFDRLQDGAKVLVPAAKPAARTAPAGPAQ
jgi:multidrug efflux system membrane fusion protein